MIKSGFSEKHTGTFGGIKKRGGAMHNLIQYIP